MFEAVNGMMLDVLAAVARKDYEDRRRRQEQGQAKARLKAATRAALRILSATPPLPPCSPRGCRGLRFRVPRDAAGLLSPRSLSGLRERGV